MDRSTAVGAHRLQLWRRAHDNIIKRAALWLGRQMLQMDWVERHEFYQVMVLRKPARFIIMLHTCFGPDQLLNGTNIGVAAPSGGVIILME
jgi:hypothetical protein